MQKARPVEVLTRSQGSLELVMWYNVNDMPSQLLHVHIICLRDLTKL